MDFKARFAGKTSKITKDGDLEGNRAGFDAPKNQNNLISAKSRGNSIHKRDGNDQLNITRESKFSYKGSERSAAKSREPNLQSHQSFISKPVQKLEQMSNSKEFNYTPSYS